MTITEQGQSMDRPIDPQVRRNTIRRRVYISMAVTVCILFILNWGFNRLRPSVKRDMIKTAVVERGDVVETISASGTVIPEIEYVMTSPVSASVVEILHQPGDILESGDCLLSLDLETRHLALARLDEQIQLKENQKEQAAVDLATQLNDLESQHEQRTLRYELAQSTYQQHQKMYDMGGVSQKDIDEANVSMEIARIDLEQIERSIENAHRLSQNRLSGLNLEQRILEKDRAEQAMLFEQAMTRVEHGGVLTWITEDVGATVNAGEIIARIADLNSYRVQATISDVHATKLITGMPVVARLSDGSRLPGRIAGIQPTIENGVITFTVALDNSTDTHLRSNLRVQLDLVTNQKRDVLRIANGSFAQGYGISDVFLIDGKRAHRIEATFGIAGYDWLEITDGLAEGDEVVISDMSERLYARELRLK